MKFSSLVSAFAAVSSVFAAPLEKRDDNELSASNKTILLTNDDGWAATNIRAAYRDLKNAGYNVVMVAPVSQRSGFGGQFNIPPTANLTTDGGFAYPPQGAPSWGHEEDDLNIWYFNGTPASCVAFAVNYVFPTYFDNATIDLVVAGPNEGTNLSPGMYTLSGTIGATYSAVGRGIPGIAFSGSNGNNSFFKDDVARENDVNFTPNIYARKVVEMVQILFNSSANHPNLLPLTTGINVNFPPTGDEDKSCLDPQFVFSRLSGRTVTSLAPLSVSLVTATCHPNLGCWLRKSAKPPSLFSPLTMMLLTSKHKPWRTTWLRFLRKLKPHTLFLQFSSSYTFIVFRQNKSSLLLSLQNLLNQPNCKRRNQNSFCRSHFVLSCGSPLSAMF